MSESFGERLRQLRIGKGLSQQQFGERLHVDRSTVAKWESGDRMPDALMISRISDLLGADMSELLRASGKTDQPPHVILMDDEKVILTGSVAVLNEIMPGAVIRGFTVPSQAIAYAQAHSIALAFLDIEMGRVSGLEVCRELLEINPRANVIYLTAYRDYAFDAWETGACGFMLKPLNAEKIQSCLQRLRCPVPWLNENLRGRGLDGHD